MFGVFFLGDMSLSPVKWKFPEMIIAWFMCWHLPPSQPHQCWIQQDKHLLTSWFCCVWCTPGCRLPSWLPGHTAGLYWACCQPVPQVPFCRAALWPLISQFMLLSSVTPSLVQNPAFVLIRFHAFDDCPVQEPCARSHVPWESRQHLSVWYHQQTFSWCVQLLHPDNW